MSLLVSVVVPTFRRPHYLDRCLKALLAQNFPPDAYEIIVVDDGPEDGKTRALVSAWQQRLLASYAFALPPVIAAIPVTGQPAWDSPATLFQVHPGQVKAPRLVYLPAYDTQGPAAARNLGWHSAAAPVIAFTDDDCIPDPNWLANGLSAFVSDVAAVSGRIIVPLPPDPTDAERNATGLERSDFVTANCFYRRAVLELTGGFDERFHMAWREDSDLYFTVRERNFALAWASGAVVVHPVRPERWGSSLKQQRKSFYNALLFKKHAGLYQRYIQRSSPWNYYGMLLGLAAGIGGAAAGSLPLALIGLLGWAGLYVQFCRRRLANTSHRPGHVLEMLFTSLFIPFLSIYWRLLGAIHWRVFFF